MRHRAGIVALTLALVFGLLGSATAYVYLNRQIPVPSEAADNDFTPVVISTTDITFGTELREEHLQTVFYPKDSVPSGAYGDPDSLLGLTTKVFLARREPILATKMSNIGGGLAIRIPQTMRATSMNVNSVSGVSGFVLPGDRVDVLVVIDRYGKNNEAITRTILQDIEVLAAGQKTDHKSGNPVKVQSVTLLVEPEGAEKLALALHEGKLHLVLRNPGDHHVAKVKSMTTSQIVGDAKKPVRRVRKSTPKPKPAPAPVKKETVTVIRGVEVDEQEPAVKGEDAK